MKLPNSFALNHVYPRRSDGSVALADFVAASINFQGGDVASDELVAISSAAFCQYVYEPEFNQHLAEPPDFSWYSELFSNYGIFESIGYYTGWEVREINHISNDDFWKLVQFEISNGRPVITISPETLTPALLVGYDWSEGQRIVETSESLTSEIGDGRMQGEDEVLENWLVFARPGEAPSWSPSNARHQMNVLRWASHHVDNAKEFFQDSRENYASGRGGFETFLRLNQKLKSDLAWAEFATRHVSRLVSGRRTASRVLPEWAPLIASELTADGVEELLIQLGEAYGKMANALTQDDSVGNAYSDALKYELEAHALLRKLAPSLPSAFG